MNASTLHPIVELRRFVSGCLRAIRTTRHVDAELMFDGAKDIAKDIANERINHDRETLRMISEAQAPNSPGGRNITPTEALPLRAHAERVPAILENETLARAASELARVDSSGSR